jgi:hypothetical protein
MIAQTLELLRYDNAVRFEEVGFRSLAETAVVIEDGDFLGRFAGLDA